MSKSKSKEKWLDQDGDAIPVQYIADHVKRRTVMVNTLFNRALELEAQIKDFHEQCVVEIGNYLSGIAGDIGLPWDEKNTKLMSFDQSRIIEIAIGKKLTFDELLGLAKQKIDLFINRKLKGSAEEIKVLVNKAFEVDQAGNVDAKLILSLQQNKFQDPDWIEAMNLINEATKTSASKSYFRFKERAGDQRELRLVNLSFSAVSEFKQYAEPKPRAKKSPLGKGGRGVKS